MASSRVMIRNYRPTDLNSCRALWRELTEWHREIYSDPSIGGKNPERQFDKHLKTVGRKRIWVASQGSEILGLVGLVMKANEAEIEPIIVTRKSRGRQVGSKLLKRAIEEARKQRVRIVTVRPVARNQKTIKFLHRHGFKNVGFVELFMDLSNRKWKSGIRFHDRNFRF